ncbi:hypothetical protein ACFQ3N_12970 [Virgibacillus byunsanensis]|uniref:Uncharacterized protein n=1 Tax=Virgibacillus byunsanensis TaxID=570945 RepID=A0ABW3LMN4_9BACI
MTKETEKKGMGWFKGVLSNQNQDDQPTVEPQISTESRDEQIINEKETEQADTTSENHLFTKDNQEKVTLDMIVSLENMLKDRQLIVYKNTDLEEQLNAANDTITRFKHDQVKKDQLIQERDREIRDLESNLTDKQMSYDQLLEDYKEYQTTSNNEYQKISNQLDKETHKYNKLNEESTKAQYQGMLKIKELEEKVRDLEIENQKYAEQNHTILNEKDELMQTINDFTERMSFSFSPKTTASHSSDSSE